MLNKARQDHESPLSIASSSRSTLKEARISKLPFSEADLDEIEDESTRRLLPLLLPPCKDDEDPLWGLSTEEPTEGWDADLEAKLARFHDLKAQGIHFNESLMSNHSFNNPHIYSHLVEFVDIDETRSNFPDLMGPKAWNPHDPEVLRDGDLDRITKQQEAAENEREARQKRAQKRSIGFVSSTADNSSADEKGKGRHRSRETRERPETDRRKDRRHNNGTRTT